jgi:hypothetical protein
MRSRSRPSKKTGPERRRRLSRVLLAVCAIAAMLGIAGATAFAALGGFDAGKLDLSPKARQFLQHVQQKDQVLADDLRPQPAGVHPPPKDPFHRPPVDAPRRPVLAGKVQRFADGGVPVPFPAQVLTCTTLWEDLQGTSRLAVYAGSRPSDPQQGVLIVLKGNVTTGEDQAGGGEFDTPRRVGALTLRSVRGNTVFFTFPGGGGTFDLITRRFVLRGA